MDKISRFCIEGVGQVHNPDICRHHGGVFGACENPSENVYEPFALQLLYLQLDLYVSFFELQNRQDPSIIRVIPLFWWHLSCKTTHLSKLSFSIMMVKIRPYPSSVLWHFSFHGFLHLGNPWKPIKTKETEKLGNRCQILGLKWRAMKTYRNFSSMIE